MVDALADMVSEAIRYWLYTHGEGSSLWEEFCPKGIMASGWGCIGDLRNFDSKDTMKQNMKKLHGHPLSYMNSAHATWQFASETKIGDIVFAKRNVARLLV